MTPPTKDPVSQDFRTIASRHVGPWELSGKQLTSPLERLGQKLYRVAAASMSIMNAEPVSRRGGYVWRWRLRFSITGTLNLKRAS